MPRNLSHPASYEQNLWMVAIKNDEYINKTKPLIKAYSLTSQKYVTTAPP